MVCKSVREDNLRSLASKFSPVQTQNHIITYRTSMNCTLCIARYLTLNIEISMKGALRESYCVDCTSVREDNPQALTDAKPYNNLLIEPACICTLCIAGYLLLDIEISIKCTIMI